MSKKRYIAMKLYNEKNVTLPESIALTPPNGCVGAMLVFSSKKTAKAFCGKNVCLMEVVKEDRL